MRHTMGDRNQDSKYPSREITTPERLKGIEMQKESESGSGQMQRGSQKRARAVSLGVPFPTLNDIAKAQLQRSRSVVVDLSKT